MRKRQVKKFARNSKKNSEPYREAMRGGSKKFDRRRKAFGKYWTNGLSNWSESRARSVKVAQLEKDMDGAKGWDEMGTALLSMSFTLTKFWKAIGA